MKLLSLFSLLLFFSIGNLGYAQTNETKQSDYNLPPGYRLDPNRNVIDLSFKLEGKTLEKDVTQEIKFLKQVTDDELNLTSSEYQNYIREGREFIDSLSQKIKSIYNEEELWYIYAFDQKLKNQLSLIQ